MEREETEQGRGRRDQKPRPRSWTQRTREPLRFRRYTDTDDKGRSWIIYNFDQGPQQPELPQEVYNILQHFKLYLPNTEGGEARRSGLEFKRDRKHGPHWRLPDDQLGRAIADAMDHRLLDLAREMEANEGKGQSR